MKHRHIILICVGVKFCFLLSLLISALTIAGWLLRLQNDPAMTWIQGSQPMAFPAAIVAVINSLAGLVLVWLFESTEDRHLNEHENDKL